MEQKLELQVPGGELVPEQERPQQAFDVAATEVVLPRTLLSRTIYVHMKPYSQQAYKELQEARAMRMQAGGDYVDLKDGGKTETSVFFWKHFVRLSGPGMKRPDGSMGTPEQHHEFVRTHPRFDFENSVTRSYLTPHMKIKHDEELYPGSLLDLTEEDSRVTLLHDLYFEKDDREARIEMTHVFQPETEIDKRRFISASGLLRFYHQTRESERRVNYDTLGQLYNHLIRRVEGATVNGQPCDESNKEEWVKLVPMAYKDITLTELFKGVQEKNVS